jgi:hypothetical protein
MFEAGGPSASTSMPERQIEESRLTETESDDWDEDAPISGALDVRRSSHTPSLALAVIVLFH